MQSDALHLIFLGWTKTQLLSLTEASAMNVGDLMEDVKWMFWCQQCSNEQVAWVVSDDVGCSANSGGSQTLEADIMMEANINRIGMLFVGCFSMQCNAPSWWRPLWVDKLILLREFQATTRQAFHM